MTHWTLRPATLDDLAFIRALREATMRPLIEATQGWDEQAQRGYADESLVGHIVLVDGTRVGVVTVVDRGRELHLAWLALLPSYQGAGLGTALIRRAQAEASSTGRPLSLHVLQVNPAVRLYTRLGFVTDDVQPVPGSTSPRLRMRWTPGTAAGPGGA